MPCGAKNKNTMNAKQKVTLAKCKEIAADLIRGAYDKVVLFKDADGNETWEVYTSSTSVEHDDDYICSFTYVNEHDSKVSELARRMHDALKYA
jgi:hypothetical protein